jgi:hypothetical protein
VKPEIVTALVGLVGVIVGSLMSAASQYWMDRRQKAKAVAYLATRVSFALDEFSSGCREVCNDDGLLYGQRDERGCLSPQAAHPVFNPATLDVEWKSLDAQLMYDILDFPNRVRSANSTVSDAEEYGSGDPDHEEFFEARKIEFSALGLAAIELAARVRREAKIHPRPTEDWSMKEELTRLSTAAQELSAQRRTAIASAQDARRLRANPAAS